jgi:hypothetical protein
MTRPKARKHQDVSSGLDGNKHQKKKGRGTGEVVGRAVSLRETSPRNDSEVEGEESEEGGKIT